MRIALVKRRCSLIAGGSERYCVNLARNLTARGHDVTVIGERIDEDLVDEIRFLPVHVNRATSWTRNKSFARNAQRVADSERFDIVYGLGRAYGLDVVRVTERLQAHWVNVHYRGTVNRFFQHLNPRHRTLIGLERDIYRSQQVRRIITQSQLDRELVAQYYDIPTSKLRTVYNGVDLGIFHPAIQQERESIRRTLGAGPSTPLLIFASMDFDGKGLRWVLQALDRIRDTAAELVVLGTGPVRRFRSLAHRLRLGQRVHFLGRQPEIQRFYGAGDLFVLPTAYEPFPNVNLEAMACGLPALTTQTAGGADIIRHGDNGYVISEMRNVDAMVSCLRAHLQQPAAQRQQMSLECRTTAEALTLDRNVDQTLEVFREIIDEKLCA